MYGRFLSKSARGWQALGHGPIDEACVDAVCGGGDDIYVGYFVGDDCGSLRVSSVGPDLNEGGVSGLSDGSEIAK